MLELIYHLRLPVLDDDRHVRPLVRHLAALPGFAPDRYDMNQMENWRGYDEERAVVDALTQRTQMFRLAGANDAIAMIALGKHGEPPTAIVRWEHDRSEEVVASWPSLFATLPIASAVLTSDAWRSTHATPAFAYAWPAGSEPATLPGEVQRHDAVVIARVS